MLTVTRFKMLSTQKKIALVTFLTVAGAGTFLALQPPPGPCRQIRALCESKGFELGKTPTERRAFQENCLRPLVEGQTVRDITLDPELAESCKQRMNRRRARINDPNDDTQ